MMEFNLTIFAGSSLLSQALESVLSLTDPILIFQVVRIESGHCHLNLYLKADYSWYKIEPANHYDL